jgi:hypothetical protein
MFGIVYEISFDFINLKLGISVFYLKKKFSPPRVYVFNCTQVIGPIKDNKRIIRYVYLI